MRSPSLSFSHAGPSRTIRSPGASPVVVTPPGRPARVHACFGASPHHSTTGAKSPEPRVRGCYHEPRRPAGPLGVRDASGDTWVEEVVLGAVVVGVRHGVPPPVAIVVDLGRVLIAVVGGLVLAAAAAGRRTATAFPRFVAAHGYDFIVFNFHPFPAWPSCPTSPPSRRPAIPSTAT